MSLMEILLWRTVMYSKKTYKILWYINLFFMVNNFWLYLIYSHKVSLVAALVSAMGMVASKYMEDKSED